MSVKFEYMKKITFKCREMVALAKCCVMISKRGFSPLNLAIKPGMRTTNYHPNECVRKRGKYVCVTDLRKQ